MKLKLKLFFQFLVIVPNNKIITIYTYETIYYLQHKNLKGSFDPLAKRNTSQENGLNTHEYILKIVPSVHEDYSGTILNSYQYTFGHKSYITYHHSGKIIPAVWFKYELQPITLKQTEQRQSFYAFLTSVCFFLLYKSKINNH